MSPGAWPLAAGQSQGQAVPGSPQPAPALHTQLQPSEATSRLQLITAVAEVATFWSSVVAGMAASYRQC